MDLPSTFDYQGWSIRYKLATSNSKTDQRQLKSLVFVHGTPWSSVVYRPIIEALLAKGLYQLLVYDLPGYGQSQQYNSDSTSSTSRANFPGDTSVAFQAETLAALLKHTQLDGQNGHPSPAVIAHDIAGTIVLRAHLLHACDFTSMLLVDANAILPWGDGFYKLARSNPQTFLELPPAIFEAVVRAVTQSATFNPIVLETGWEDELAAPWLDDDASSGSGTGSAEHQRNFIRQIAQANDADVAEMLDAQLYGQVRCDVKILWGEQDAWIPQEKIEELVRLLGSERVKEVVFVPEAGHLVMLDQPTRFGVEVFDWVSKG